MIKEGFKFKIKYIKHNVIKGQNITSFNIGDKIKGSASNGYQNYQFTVWGENIPLEETDKVVIKTIDAISASEYNGKIYIGISGTIDVEAAQDEGYVAEQKPGTFSPQPETFFNPAMSDTEKAPWEL